MTDLITYSIIIDDLVFPDGSTMMGVLGGSGPQTAFGMKLWADEVGLVGGVGHDFPADALAWLAAMEIDLSGVRRHEQHSTLRAWQIFEDDGRRIQVWRSQGQAIPDQLALRFEQLPPAYRTARGFHYGVHPDHPNLAVAHALRANGVCVAIEPFKHADHRLAPAELYALCSAGQIFSPNLYEVESMIGPGDPRQQLERLAAAGAQIVALRLGAGGSMIQRADTGETWHIPAVPTAVVDPCGAGNAYCGSFLAGWVQCGDLCTAGLYGAVAASFLVEQIGLPPANLTVQRAEARRRLSSLQGRARRLA
jgi:sugar/nucleoside kinase (ribokinase family)